MAHLPTKPNLLGPCEGRLYWVINELGYVSPNGVSYATLTADICRRATGNIGIEELRAILGRGREIKASELIVICQGLDIDPEMILYGEDGPPTRRRRKKGVALMDVVEPPL